jgi:hypothetical protein
MFIEDIEGIQGRIDSLLLNADIPCDGGVDGDHGGGVCDVCDDRFGIIIILKRGFSSCIVVAVVCDDVIEILGVGVPANQSGGIGYDES